MSLTEAALSAAIGTLTGAVSSLLVWWWLNRHRRPRIQIVPTLAEYGTTHDSWIRSQTKLRNAGKRRAVDVKITMRLSMPNLVRPGSTEVLTISEETVPGLRGGRELRFMVRPEDAPGLARYYRYLPSAIATAHRDGKHIRLRSLLDAVPGSSVTVFALSFDERAGGRGYAAKTFRSEDLRVGRFIGDGHSGILVDPDLPGAD